MARPPQDPRGDGFVGGFECIRRGGVDIDKLLPFVIKIPYSVFSDHFCSLNLRQGYGRQAKNGRKKGTTVSNSLERMPCHSVGRMSRPFSVRHETLGGWLRIFC